MIDQARNIHKIHYEHMKQEGMSTHGAGSSRIPLVLSNRAATSALPTHTQRGDGRVASREGVGGERASDCMRTCVMSWNASGCEETRREWRHLDDVEGGGDENNASAGARARDNVA